MDSNENADPYRDSNDSMSQDSDSPDRSNSDDSGTDAPREQNAPQSTPAPTGSVDTGQPNVNDDLGRGQGGNGGGNGNGGASDRGQGENNRNNNNRNRGPRQDRNDGGGGGNRNQNNARRNRHQRRGRGQGSSQGGQGGQGNPGNDRGPRRDNQQQQQQQSGGMRAPLLPVTADSESVGWFDAQRDGGFIRRAANSYLADVGDAFIPPNLIRQYGLRRGDQLLASTGHDPRNRVVVCDILKINDADPAEMSRRPDFGSLIASYPDKKLTLETGKPAKSGPELTRRAIDLIAPIGYGQRALIVAPARAGKTMLLQAIVEGVAINHPQAVLLVLLVDERPEEVSEMIAWGYGEVVASSFDMPAVRHTDVTEMVLERARRMVEMGRDVVIVLDSITRMARAFNTVERGTGRTLSGGLDATAMAKPKAFFGSARSVSPENGGGSLTIIATALVETGSRMDDVIFEEFKGTGNCEIKLDRSLAERRIFPAIDIGTSGTRREDKLFKAEQLEHVYTLRRGLQQMPASSAMEWLIKRIASTPNNDALLEGL